MSGTVLLTGASAGIGYELAQIFARAGHDLVLVARSKNKLAQIAKELSKAHSIKATALPADLSSPRAADEIYRALKKTPIEILVNNAGYGSHGVFPQLDLKSELGQLEVNVMSLVRLTHLFARDMQARRSGRILNVASAAAFQPGPYMSVYYASKAFVLHFSEGLAEELREFGVSVSALCPGPVTTGFQARANITESPMAKSSLLALDAHTVAREAYEGLMAGRAVITPGVLTRLMAFSTRFSPRALNRKIAARINGKP